ncbi:MT-A70-domain-containing protein [Artomyces pyxidatus]|uniref:MT-A70-domain-containing protein n=1 Tax=Artomyces pyxidatus TaxID=48021 RepID=A0ACB8SVB6_9AGAM|nr:MT-A70-domain-containing protein [Artomyces pyxidatus]
MVTVVESLSSANDLLAQHTTLLSRVRDSQRTHRRQLRALSSPPQDILKLPLIPSPRPSPSPSPPSSPLLIPRPKPIRADLPPAKKARAARYPNYVPEEETIRNDYSQRYVDGGEWPQNWVLGAEPERRFEEYPKQQRLLALKKASVTEYSLPPIYLPISELSTVQPSKFDVILIDPPFSSSFTWDHLQDMPIPTLAADPSFVFLWVGSGAGEGLERGREVLAKWGYRRCEDVCWVKTNKTSNRGPGTDPPTTSLLTRTNQHCLIGIRGTVRRSTDSWFVHCNVDTDVILWEGDPTDPTLKPPEMYTLIENFCLGVRRLELFGRARTVRRGWVTALADGEDERLPAVQEQARGADAPTNGLGQALGVDSAVAWDRDAWETKLREWMPGGKAVVPITADIDALRPKSPVRGGPAGAGGMAWAGAADARNVPKGPRGIMKPDFPHAQLMAQQPMMGMPMGGVDGMGMVGWGGGMMRGMGMGNMMGMGTGMGMGMGQQVMGGQGMVGAQGMGMAQQGMGGQGFGGFDGMQGMGWMGGADQSGQGAQFMDHSQMWDGGMGEGMNMGMGNMGNMGNMGMGMNMGMGNMMGMNGMGMGPQGQWNNGGYDGYQ